MAAARQGELFSSEAGTAELNGGAPAELTLLRRQLLDWQERVAGLQASQADEQVASQGLLALLEPGPPESQPAAAPAIDPFSLAAQSLSFWRWPSPPVQGAAIYFVVDRPPHLQAPLLLYVGETGRADRRWKGEHDCKSYLAAYNDALRRSELSAQLSIRFWSDVPAAIRPRRALEQALIRRWLPPFNKETRERWATPFTADPH
jgi:hypothetical protein